MQQSVMENMKFALCYESHEPPLGIGLEVLFSTARNLEILTFWNSEVKCKILLLLAKKIILQLRDAQDQCTARQLTLELNNIQSEQNENKCTRM